MLFWYDFRENCIQTSLIMVPKGGIPNVAGWKYRIHFFREINFVGVNRRFNHGAPFAW